MEHSFLMSLNGAEFKAYLKDALTEIMREMEKAVTQVPEILDISEASVFVKLKKNTLYEKTSSKTIPHFKKGQRLYFKRKELEKWLEDGKVKTQEDLQSEAASYTMQKRK